MAYKKYLSRYFFRKLIDDYNLDRETQMYFKEEFSNSEVSVKLFCGDDLVFEIKGISHRSMKDSKEEVLDQCYRELSMVFTINGVTSALKRIKDKKTT